MKKIFKIPLIHNFKATNYFNAFILNALATAAIAALAIEIRSQLYQEKSFTYIFFSNFYGSRILTDKQKALTVFITAFFTAICVYFIMYLIFVFGGGMLTNN
jgi:hypothetical protein